VGRVGGRAASSAIAAIWLPIWLPSTRPTIGSDRIKSRSARHSSATEFTIHAFIVFTQLVRYYSKLLRLLGITTTTVAVALTAPITVAALVTAAALTGATTLAAATDRAPRRKLLLSLIQRCVPV
jgi:hypothetical protein